MGRKATSELERYKTICWMSLVKDVSGKTPYALEYELFKDLQEMKYWYDCRPRILEKYLRGKVVPRYVKGKSSHVTELEELYPDTEWLFSHLFWSVIEPSDTFLQNVDQFLHELNKSIKMELFNGPNIDGASEIPLHRAELAKILLELDISINTEMFIEPNIDGTSEILLQRAELEKSDYEGIAREGTLDSFAVFFILLNEAKLKKSHALYYRLLSVFDSNYKKLIDMDHFFGLGKKVLSYIDALHPERYSFESDELISIEASRAAIKNLKPFKITQRITGVTKTVNGKVESNDHDIWNSQICPNCGADGPWNGVMCLNCGRKDDPWD